MIEERFLEELDVNYAYNLAKRMEEYKCHPILGYRPAGSEAEFLTGELLLEEMKKIGLCDVHKDKINVDAWEFKKAELTYTDVHGTLHRMQLGAYQTQLVTDGAREFPLVYIGKGTMHDYQGIDVTGKLVLVDINQREEWWINYPVYQAYLKGAKALIATQIGGYGEIDEEALNAQDIAGPDYAPAFSISWKDAQVLKDAFKARGELKVTLDADTRVVKNTCSYNIIGSIPGKNPDRMILLSAHYDSYFDGFQDDNTAVAMFLGIARAMIRSGYQPENTLIFCAMAAEEWGVSDSKYDWSTGAYEEVFTVHPEWRTKVFANLNFELPAVYNGPVDGVRSTYEYEEFIREFLDDLPGKMGRCPKLPRDVFEGGIMVKAPIETWSDDFSIAISGIPSLVNDFSGGSFMVTHYHSQFDNDSFYSEDVYLLHHEMYGLLVMAFDRLKIAPLNFYPVFENASKRLDLRMCRKTGANGEMLDEALWEAADIAEAIYAIIYKINNGELPAGSGVAEAERQLLDVFKKCQDAFVRLNWQDDVLFPMEAVQENIKYLEAAYKYLSQGEIRAALRMLYSIDNNQYAFLFDEAVYTHFTEYVLNQDKSRLKWGSGRIIHHENLYWLVESLMSKEKEPEAALKEELEFLQEVMERQRRHYCADVEYMLKSVKEINKMLQEAQKTLEMHESR
ncbi:MAG: M28 family peptidase [Clostridiales bacterium]|nr:M28 family peptidase [Clostridiales bacterium]